MAEDIHWARADILLADILAYVDHLRAHYGLEVTIHRAEGFATMGVHHLMPYNLHYNPLCMMVKNVEACWERCKARQGKVMQKAQGGPFFGMCWAGVSEYVFPIYNMTDQVAAFISISGYACRRSEAIQRIANVAEAHGLNRQEMIDVFDNALRHEIPDMATMRTLVQPLANQFTLMSLLYQRSAPEPNGDDTFYIQVLRYLNENHMRDVSLTALGKRFNCSVSHLSHLFRRYHHGTMSDYIGDLRIASAKRYLLNTQMSIQNIALTLGYADSNYFSTAFRRRVGVSPRAWRDAQRRG